MPLGLSLAVAPPLSGHFRARGAVLSGVKIRPATLSLQERVAAAIVDAAEGYRGLAIDELGPISALREAFLALEIRACPSPEAMLREILAGVGFSQINGAVDAARLTGLRVLLPIGVYDAGRLSGRRVLLRRGRLGEPFEAVGGGALSCVNWPVWADDIGPFGSLICDSTRALVTDDTEELLVLVSAPSTFPESAAEAALEQALREVQEAIGGNLEVNSELSHL
jgi:DNA/RNA-binding domain of Phe-tRNA-synthetase-like protein